MPLVDHGIPATPSRKPGLWRLPKELEDEYDGFVDRLSPPYRFFVRMLLGQRLVRLARAFHRVSLPPSLLKFSARR
jgi:hypothetical protein